MNTSVKRFLTDNRNLLLILSLFLFNLIIKLAFATRNQIDIDEPFTIYWAQADIKQLFGLFKDENNPPLFFLLMHFWVKLFGTGIFSVRFLPALFGSVSVLYVYKIGNRFFNRFVAILSSLIFSFSDLVTYHSHDVRVYSLFLLLATISMYYFLRVWEEPKKKSNLVLWILANILLTYSHFYGFLLLFFEGAFAIFNRDFRKRTFKPLIFMIGGMIAAYLPYLKIIIARFMAAKGGTWVSKPDFQAPYFRLVEFSNQPITAVFILAIIATAIVLSVIYQAKVKSTEWAIFLWFLAPFLFMYLISFLVPMFIPKYLVFLLPAYYLSVSILVFRLTEKFKKLQLGVGAVAAILMAATSNPANGNNRQPKEMAECVKSKLTKQTSAYICPPWIDINFAYYFNSGIFSDFGNVETRLKSENIYPIYNGKEINAETLRNSNDVLFIDCWYQVTDPEGSILNTLRNTFSKEEVTEFKGYKVYRFSEKK
jgi:mannosyltransferase